jgi:DNA segregation ATPase FtsK/SpoIIIE, S-DNA-T family
VGILRPDGETRAGADVLALTVRTYYMPNEDWHELCRRGRALRDAAGTLTGHAAGDTAPSLDHHTSVVRAISTGARPVERVLPEPLASVVAYLGDDLDDREFVPTAELVEALDVEANSFGRAMADLGCPSTRDRITGEDGEPRRVRGYRTCDVRTAVAAGEE